MPTVSTFYGISIRMYYKDHMPPHFHADYADSTECVDIRNGKVIAGKLPKRAHKLVLEWWDEHRDELMDMWNTQSLEKKIPPLE